MENEVRGGGGAVPGGRMGPIVRGARWGLALAAVGAALLWAPGGALGQPLKIGRMEYLGRAGRPSQPLTAGAEVEFRDEIRLVAKVSRLRVESANPEFPPVFRFRPVGGKPGQLSLTVILIAREGRFDYRYQETAQVMEGGALTERAPARGEKSLTTELSGEPGRVVEIRVQDDLAAELRLQVEGDTLVLRAISPEEGGNPTGGAVPHYFGKPYLFLNYKLIAAGYTDNLMLEALVYEDFAVMLNYISSGGTTAMLLRGVVRQQVYRWERVSIWLEGGAGYYTVSPVDDTDTEADSPDWQFGVGSHYRWGDWGVAGTLTTTNGTIHISAVGGWQFSKTWAAVLEAQVFQGLTVYGLGATWAY